MAGNPTGDDALRIRALFTRSDGAFRFARWGRAPVPAIFGAGTAGGAAIREGIAAAFTPTGLALGAEDPELGANCLVFLVEDWRGLAEVPNLARLIPDLTKLVSTLQAAGANQYRIFDFDPDGAIRLLVSLIRLDDDLAALPMSVLALSQASLGVLLWSDHAFLSESPVRRLADGTAQLDPWHEALVRAAYAPHLPAASAAPPHADALAAAMSTSL